MKVLIRSSKKGKLIPRVCWIFQNPKEYWEGCIWGEITSKLQLICEVFCVLMKRKCNPDAKYGVYYERIEVIALPINNR